MASLVVGAEGGEPGDDSIELGVELVGWSSELVGDPLIGQGGEESHEGFGHRVQLLRQVRQLGAQL